MRAPGMAHDFGEAEKRPRWFQALVRRILVASLCAAGCLGWCATGLASAAAPPTFSASATGAGLTISLFGEKLTGADSSVCVNSGQMTSNKDVNSNATPCDSTAAPHSNAKSEGTLLTSNGLEGLATATATSAGQSVSDPSNAPTGANCSQLSTGGAQGSNGVTLGGAVSCAWAQAAVDSGGRPTASSSGQVANVAADLAGVLGPIAAGSPQSGSSDACNQDPSSSQTVGQLLGAVCTALTGVGKGGGSSAPAPVGGLFSGVSQALQNLYDVTKNDAPGDSAALAVAPAKASISQGADGTVTENATGESVQVNLFPGVGCTAGTSLATCAANAATHLTDEQDDPTAAPLITVDLGPSACSATRDPSTGSWTSSSTTSVADVSLNLPGDNISLNVPGPVGSGQTIAAGTPLQSTVRVLAASTSPVGNSATCTADALTLSLLESSTFPGGSSAEGTGGAVLVTLGQSSAAASNGGAPPAPATSAASPAPAAPGPSVSPTAVHTGVWWSGSLPWIAGALLAGIAAIGWRRTRRSVGRLPLVAKALLSWASTTRRG
jgi:hypothetical protein